jgi:diphosphomevalonate decarboxylase
MNLDGVFTRTTVVWDAALSTDELVLNDARAGSEALQRVSAHLDVIRKRLNLTAFARVTSANNFPMGAGIASSASSFAALTVAAVAAAGHRLSERELSTLARLGSGSASRSVPAGFVEWHAADTHEGSYAESIAPANHWELVDVIAIVSDAHKDVGSKAGHRTANTSDLQAARVGGAAERLRVCKDAIIKRNFASFAAVVEHDSNLMHAVMMTSQPPLFYWRPATLTVMDAVRRWRADGLHICYTLDAGPNVHVLTLADDVETAAARLRNIEGVIDIRIAPAGGGTIIES